MVGKYDLSNCLINFTTCPSGVKLIEYFPELSAFPEFINVANDNEIRIAIAISDIDSPFLKIKDIKMRIQALFEFLEIGLKTVKNQELFNDICNYKHKTIIPACCRYIQMQNHHDFASWWSLNMAFYELQRESAQPKIDKEDGTKFAIGKATMTNHMDSIATKLKNYEALLFKDVKMKQAAVKNELMKIYTYPEKYADKFDGYNS